MDKKGTYKKEKRNQKLKCSEIGLHVSYRAENLHAELCVCPGCLYKENALNYYEKNYVKRRKLASLPPQ